MPLPKGSQIFNTPKKARIKGAVDFYDYMGIPYYKIDVFRYNSISRQRGYEILAEDNWLADRTHHNLELNEEQRGRPSILSTKDLERYDRFLQDLG
jgi:NH3-dependent NAD+ synthetase